MKYYKVKKEYDNWSIYKYNKNNKLVYSGFLVGNELKTPAEYKKLIETIKNFNVSKAFDIVEVNKNKTFWFFGARFAGGTNI